MLLTATAAGAGGTPVMTTLLVVAVVAVSVAAVVDLLLQHRGELADDPRGNGAQAAARRSRGRVRSLVAAALVTVCALGLGVLLLSGATPTSRPLLVGLVCGVVGCAAAAAAAAGLVQVLRRHEPAAEVGTVRAAQPTTTRALAAVRLPDTGAPQARERATTRADRREEREQGRGRQRRETVTAVETVLGRGARAAPRPAAAVPTSAGLGEDATGSARTVVPQQRATGERRAGAGGMTHPSRDG